MSLQTGKIGENYAVLYLRACGYRVITQNYYGRYGEIDIIAYKNRTVSFIEVKTRKSDRFGRPEESITKTKMLRIKKTIMHYLINHRYIRSWQTDVVAILLNSFDEVTDLRHYMNVLL